jgi:acylphosphatase
MTQTHLLIGGYVQSVGFRRFVQKEARKLGLTGWVRNLSDRRLEVVAQGSKEALEQLILLCRSGPFMAEVKGVSVAFEEGDEVFTEFEIRETA